MNKAVAIAAVVLIGLSGAAVAKQNKTVISIDHSCDVLTFYQDRVLKTAFTMTEEPGCTNFFGDGFAAKVRKLGGSVTMALSVPDAGGQYMMRIDYPFVTGGSLQIYFTKDGHNLQGITDGTYTVLSGTPTSVKAGKSVLMQRQSH
jgi:hypothetical protein